MYIQILHFECNVKAATIIIYSDYNQQASKFGTNDPFIHLAKWKLRWTNACLFAKISSGEVFAKLWLICKDIYKHVVCYYVLVHIINFYCFIPAYMVWIATLEKSGLFKIILICWRRKILRHILGGWMCSGKHTSFLSMALALIMSKEEFWKLWGNKLSIINSILHPTDFTAHKFQKQNLTN